MALERVYSTLTQWRRISKRLSRLKQPSNSRARWASLLICFTPVKTIPLTAYGAHRCSKSQLWMEWEWVVWTPWETWAALSSHLSAQDLHKVWACRDRARVFRVTQWADLIWCSPSHSSNSSSPSRTIWCFSSLVQLTTWEWTITSCSSSSSQWWVKWARWLNLNNSNSSQPPRTICLLRWTWEPPSNSNNSKSQPAASVSCEWVSHTIR